MNMIKELLEIERTTLIAEDIMLNGMKLDGEVLVEALNTKEEEFSKSMSADELLNMFDL